jgi:hypothetical protein
MWAPNYKFLIVFLVSDQTWLWCYGMPLQDWKARRNILIWFVHFRNKNNPSSFNPSLLPCTFRWIPLLQLVQFRLGGSLVARSYVPGRVSTPTTVSVASDQAQTTRHALTIFEYIWDEGETHSIFETTNHRLCEIRHSSGCPPKARVL